MGLSVVRVGVSLVALLFVSGCVATGGAGPSGAAPAGPAAYDDHSGAIAGSVLDDEAVPLADVSVAILEAGVQTLSDAAGRFALSNVAPGTHTVIAQRLGYEVASRRVTVAAGEVAEAMFVLEPIEIAQTFHTGFFMKGYFECSWTFVITTGPCFYPVTGTNTSVVPVDPWTNNKRQVDYGVNPGVMTVFNEMAWSRTTAATADRMSVFLSYQKRTGNHWFCNVNGASPVILRWDRADDSKSNKEPGVCATGGAQLPGAEPQTIPYDKPSVLTSRANVGPTPGVPVSAGFAIQQSFDLYVTIFYWGHAEDDFTALPDR